MSLETSASESEEKDVNKRMLAGKMCLTDYGEENCALMVFILLMKNVAKLSAVKSRWRGRKRTKEQGHFFKECIIRKKHDLTCTVHLHLCILQTLLSKVNHVNNYLSRITTV